MIASEVTFPCADGFAMDAFLARPSGEGPFPGIVLIFEASGLHVEMKRLAEETARAGYAVIAPNLYARGNAFVCFLRLFREAKAGKGRGVDDLLAARMWLAGQTFVDGERMATMGFCLGGGYALLLAKTGLFKAAADFYGEPPAKLDGACPVVASYGDRDALMMRHVPQLRSELQRLAIASDVKIYAGVGHGFMNQQPNPVLGALLRSFPLNGRHDAPAATDAMQRMLAFLAQHV